MSAWSRSYSYIRIKRSQFCFVYLCDGHSISTCCNIRRDFKLWIMLSEQRELFEIINSQTLKTVVIVSADGLAPYVTKTSAWAVMTTFWFRECTGTWTVNSPMSCNGNIGSGDDLTALSHYLKQCWPIVKLSIGPGGTHFSELSIKIHQINEATTS